MRGIISQSNFLPWRGYFACLREVEILIMYDSEQYTRRDWRNRNKIWNNESWEWLSVPIQSKGNYLSAINSIKLFDSSAIPSAINRIKNRYAAYSKTQGYEFVIKLLSESTVYEYLSDVNKFTTSKICEYLKIDLKIFTQEIDFQKMDKNMKLIQICNNFGIQRYFTGPTSRSYIDEEIFAKNGIEVTYFNFDNLIKTTDPVEYSIAHYIITEDMQRLLNLTTLRQSPRQ